MAKQLASVPEESTTSFTASSPPCYSYRESIRSVIGPEWRIRSAFSSRSGQSGSNYSSNSCTSSSYLSNVSGFSVGSAAAGAAEFGELTEIAYRMISDGYTRRMVQAFKYDGEQDRALETWFIELDISLVFQMRVKDGNEWRKQLLENSGSCLQELAQRWIRALTITVISMKRLIGAVDETLAVGRFGEPSISALVAAVHETLAVGRFGKASISAMLVFVDAIINFHNVDKLQAMLYMYICVSNASYDMLTIPVVCSQAQSIFNEIGASLQTEEINLIQAISSTMMEVMQKLMKDDVLWATEIERGLGEVHRSIRFLGQHILFMRKADALVQNSPRNHKTKTLRGVIDETIAYTKDQLLRKSEMCRDNSLRYLFLLNNSYFLAQLSESSGSLNLDPWSGHNLGLKLTADCEKYIDSYIDVSWGHVLFCVQKLNPEIHRWFTPSVAEYQSSFDKTYRAQMFWKVPDPLLRSLLRETIINRVIPGYRDYLEDHPKADKQAYRENNSVEVLEDKLRGLFEG